MVKKKDTTTPNQKTKKLSKEELEYNSLPDNPCNRELFNKYVKNKEHYNKVWRLKHQGYFVFHIAREIGVCVNTLKLYYGDILEATNDEIEYKLVSKLFDIANNDEHKDQFKALDKILKNINPRAWNERLQEIPVAKSEPIKILIDTKQEIPA